jgi:divalent metal cation (Fe/Co/Zn/Cd) transporter
VQDLFHADDVHSYSLPAIATFLSGILGVFITVYLRILAKRSDSQMLKIAAIHWLSDTVLSLGVSAGFFLGLIMQKAGYTSITPYLDPAMSIILALFFIFTPFRLGMRNFFELLDAVPHADLHGKIKKAVSLCKPELFSVYRMRIRKAGQKLFLEFCFSVHDNPTIKTVEELTGNFERDLKTHLPDCDVVVYFKSK